MTTDPPEGPRPGRPGPSRPVSSAPPPDDLTALPPVAGPPEETAVEPARAVPATGALDQLLAAEPAEPAPPTRPAAGPPARPRRPASARRTTRRREPRLRVHVKRTILAVVLLVAVLVGAAIGVAGLVGNLFEGPADYSGEGTGEVIVQVQPGATPATIAERLEELGVVKSAEAFVEAAADDDERARRIQPGFYRLRAQMSGAAAFDLLLDPAARAESRFTVPEGLPVSQILPVISEGMGIPIDDLRAAVEAAKADPAVLGLPSYAPGPEGFLFPATYEQPPDATAVDVLRAMVTRFKQEAAALNLEARAQAQGITPLEAVTLASIVEREVNQDDDRGRVARVIYNRLANRADFPTLGMDSTTQYAVGDYDGGLTQSQLDDPSPYNTRRSPGIPPGPIANPGSAALEAVLAPPEGPWTYFVFIPSQNQTIFTDDPEEFARLEARYRQETGGG